MDLNIHTCENIPVIELPSQISLTVADDFKESVKAIINRHSYPRVIFDFQRTETIDSSGIAAFIHLYDTYSGQTDIRFCHVNTHIMQIFEFANLQGVFHIHKNERDAAVAVAS